MSEDIYDIAVIGGGAAGMMAAGRAAELGAKVILLEKNASLGKKLRITGGGRCNICHAEFDTRVLTEKYGKKGKALFSAFSQFDVAATIEFFESRGLKIKVEAEKRAFPVSDSADDVLNLMHRYITDNNVTIRTKSPVDAVHGRDRMIKKVLVDGKPVEAKNYIFATGGKSRPETGSTGDAFPWMQQLGHTIAEQDVALVPVTISDAWISDLAGMSFKSAKLSMIQDGKTIHAAKGKILFTHNGLSGPLVLNMSKRIGEQLYQGSVVLSLDLYPSMDAGALDKKVLAIFDAGKNKLIKNHIGEIVPPRLGHVMLSIAKIDPETPLYRLSKPDRTKFVIMLKDFRMNVSGLLGTEKAVVTGGGVDLKEIDFKTMRSKLYDNLYVIGDLLDFDRPSGGYSLQICWTTGYIAGTAAAS